MPELLAPAGDLRCLETALRFGADAVYIGGPALQLRAAKAGFTHEQAAQAVQMAHSAGKKLYVAANSFLEESEISLAADYARFLSDIGADAVIASDMGMVSILKESAPELEIHVSTQANCLNSRATLAWKTLGASRVILGREATLEDIKRIRDHLPGDMQIETFVHGAMCISYSGRCLLSAYLTGRSANRGGCTQPCRWNYVLEERTRPGMYLPVIEDEHGTAILSSHDLCAVEYLAQLREAGVDSFKIEGRMKSEYYVATVVGAYRRHMDGLWSAEQARAELDAVNHRPYSTGFYFSDLKYGHDNRGEYLADYLYAGYVLSAAAGQIEIEQHGEFNVGDELELVSPNENARAFRVETLIDDRAESAVRANRSGLRYRLNCPYEAQRGDILRIRAPKEGGHTETLNRGSAHAHGNISAKEDA